MSLHRLSWSLLRAGLSVVTPIAFGAVSPAATALRHEGSGSLSQQASVSDRLYFGRKHPAGFVTETEGATFLADVVTPRFPQGLTVWAADGSGVTAHTGSIVSRLLCWRWCILHKRARM